MITIRLDQRTLALYGVSHADYARELRTALQPALQPVMNQPRTLEILPAAGPQDALEFDCGLIELSVLGDDAENIRRVIENVWAALPRTVIVDGKQYSIASAEQGRFRISLKTRPEHATFSGAWREIQYWVHDPRARLAAGQSLDGPA
jgi:hypothetical protein